MQYGIAAAIVTLLFVAALVARGALPWRRGLVLISAVGAAIVTVEALVRSGYLAVDEASPALALVAVGMLWLATMFRRDSSPTSRGGRVTQ